MAGIGEHRREDRRLRKSSFHLLKVHLHWICVFCHFKLRFGCCPQPLTVARLCGDQAPIRNELFDSLSNITFRDV